MKRINEVLSTNGKNSLTETEIKVLKLLCQGALIKNIAIELSFSVRKVERIKHTLHEKTGATNDAELGIWGYLQGYVRPLS